MENTLFTLKPRTNYGIKRITFSDDAAQLWNELLQSVRARIWPLNQFKKEIYNLFSI